MPVSRNVTPTGPRMPAPPWKRSPSADQVVAGEASSSDGTAPVLASSCHATRTVATVAT